MPDSILSCHQLTKSFRDGREHIHVLDAVDCTVRPGELLGIVGRSGSGKTTLLNCLSGIDKPTSGTVYFANKPLSQLSSSQVESMRSSAMGFIFQFHFLLPGFSAQENVAMARRIAGVSHAQAMEEAKHQCEQVGLSHRLGHSVTALSGGERQRVAIARALVGQPKVVFADEPTGNLDEKTGQEVISVMLELTKRRDTAFVVVTHDKWLASQLDRVVTLSEGRLITTS